MDESRLLSILSSWKDEIMNEFAKKFESLEQTITSKFEGRLSMVENTLNKLEMESKTKNILLHGLAESENNLNDLETISSNFIKDKLYNEFCLRDVNFMKRIGKPQIGKIRPIVISLLSRRVRDILIKNNTKLKNCQQYITEDYPKNVQEIRKKLIPSMIEARKEGKYAIIKYDKLIIKDFHKPKDNTKKRPLVISPLTENGTSRKVKHDRTSKKEAFQPTLLSFLTETGSRENLQANTSD